MREGRHGRTGHDATLVLAAGSPGFGFRSGEVWGSTWAGAGRGPPGRAQRRRPRRDRRGRAARPLRGGSARRVVCLPARVPPGAPTAWTASAPTTGSQRPAHLHPRTPPGRAQHLGGRLPRPPAWTWLTDPADVAARPGSSAVLDDGWFGNRRSDTAGLGDWYVAADVWPDGLNPLIDHRPQLGHGVRALGRAGDGQPRLRPVPGPPRLGPVRVGPDGRLPEPWRNQQVLDLANPDCYAFIRDRLDALLGEHDIAFLKWDHNRDLVEAGHAGRPRVHAQTLATYRLLDELRARHPGVEIESCASGGGRVDLGILHRTDRVWASDTNDALERQPIQRWTQLLVPPSWSAATSARPRPHHRPRPDLAFRVATALFGHFGIEWDHRRGLEPEQGGPGRGDRLLQVDAAAAPQRPGGAGRPPQPAAYLHGVVAADRAEALFAYVQLTSSAYETPGLAHRAGPDRAYRRAGAGRGRARDQAGRGPGVAGGGRVTLGGRALAEVGLPLPVLRPEQALLLHLTGA